MARQGYIIGYLIADKLDLNEVAAAMPHQVILKDSFEIFLKLDDFSYIYAVSYGSIVFLNIPEEERRNILHQLYKGPTAENHYLHFEDMAMEVSEERGYQVLFNTLVIPRLTDQIARIILLNIGQSVALFRYMKLSEDLLNQTRNQTNHLEQKGRLNIRGRSLMKFIGRTLNLKNAIAENLYIFDAPSSTWEDQDLNRLNEDLSRNFDLGKRHRTIQENLSIVKENLDLFKDVNLHNQSALLEWIIIILILFEVIQIFIT